LTWQDNANDETGFALFDGDIFVANVTANTTSYIIDGLLSNSYHCYHIYAFNNAGDSTWTDWACTTTQPNSCITSAGVWQNSGIDNQLGAFIIEFDATPNGFNMDGVMGLSAGAATGYADLAAIARFNPDGFIDARNGSAYQAAFQTPYIPGVSYHFWMEISITDHVYSVYVTPAGGVTQLVGENFAFRSEQSTIANLNNVAVYANTNAHQVCNIVVFSRPLNDEFHNAIAIPGLPYSNTQNTVWATSDDNDPRSTCWDVGRNVWYRYTATSDNIVRFETTGSSYDTWLAVFTGNQGSFVEVGCSDDYNAQSFSLVDLPVTAGTTYYILIGGDDSDAGNLVINAQVLP
jgi:hypothetical protein